MYLVANALKQKGKRGELPRWPGLNNLTPDICEIFQSFAKRIAIDQGVSRVHLDIRLWTDERVK